MLATWAGIAGKRHRGMGALLLAVFLIARSLSGLFAAAPPPIASNRGHPAAHRFPSFRPVPCRLDHQEGRFLPRAGQRLISGVVRDVP